MAFYTLGDSLIKAGNNIIPAPCGDLKIVMIDINYGDAILCQTKNKNILFDTGGNTYVTNLYKTLEENNVSVIDHLFITHPHSDHYNALSHLFGIESKVGDDTVKGTYPITVKNVYTNGFNRTFYMNTADVALTQISNGQWSLASDAQKSAARQTAAACKSISYTTENQSNGTKKVTGFTGLLDASTYTQYETRCQIYNEHMLNNSINHYIVQTTVANNRINPITINLGDSLYFKAYWPVDSHIEYMGPFINKVMAFNINGCRNSSNEKYGHGHNTNNTSILGKLLYKNFSMLITGDCSSAINNNLGISRTSAQDSLLGLTDPNELHCTVYKSCHHGQTAENPLNWMQAIHPQYEFITTNDNSTDSIRPNRIPLDNATLTGIKKDHIFCTRFQGNVTLVTDGNSKFITTQNKNPQWFDDWMARYPKDKWV